LDARLASVTVIDRPARRPNTGTIVRELEAHRRELTGHCHRMLGSRFEAEDAVQETMVRAWRRMDGFEGRSTLRTWLYRIATNVCLDMRRRPQRRAQPMDMGPTSVANAALGPAHPEPTLVQLVHGRSVTPSGGDPGEVAASREMVRLALVAALHHLPPRQRALVILRDVLGWRAREVADLLGTSEASVNSALQRARTTLDAIDHDVASARDVNDQQQELLARYVDAFERDDVGSLVTLSSGDHAGLAAATDRRTPGRRVGRFARHDRGEADPARKVPPSHTPHSPRPR
jgi:RNA polymerase sigma-70 factor, ECF subfamily